MFLLWGGGGNRGSNGNVFFFFLSILLCLCETLDFYLLNDAVFESILCLTELF